MEQSIRVFGDGNRIGVVIVIGNDFWEGSKDMSEAMMKLILLILEILIISLIRIFSPSPVQ